MRTESGPGIERVVEGTSPPEMFSEHVARYRFAGSYVSGRRVLDVACGSGYGSRVLRDAGAREVVGVDRDSEAVAYAGARYGSPGIRYLVGDAHDPPAAGPFDVIVSFETIEHLEDPDRFLSACGDRLAVDGLFIVSTPYRMRSRPDGSPVNPYHRQEWRDQDFHRLLSRRFSTIQLFGQTVALRKRPLQPSRRIAGRLALWRGFQLNDPGHIFPLPAPGFWGVWAAYPVFILALCRRD
jgi:SAM-dependent methyltransferase